MLHDEATRVMHEASPGDQSLQDIQCVRATVDVVKCPHWCCPMSVASKNDGNVLPLECGLHENLKQTEHVGDMLHFGNSISKRLASNKESILEQ